MWPGEQSETSDRAVKLGVGAASPLWPGFLFAAAAGAAYWGWTRWFRPDAILAKDVQPDLSAPPTAIEGTAVEAIEAEIAAPVAAAVQEVVFDPAPVLPPIAEPVVEAAPAPVEAAPGPVEAEPVQTVSGVPALEPESPKVEAAPKPAAAKTTPAQSPAPKATAPKAAAPQAPTPKAAAPKTAAPKAAPKAAATAPAKAKPKAVAAAPAKRKAPATPA